MAALHVVLLLQSRKGADMLRACYGMHAYNVVCDIMYASFPDKEAVVLYVEFAFTTKYVHIQNGIYTYYVVLHAVLRPRRRES